MVEFIHKYDIYQAKKRAEAMKTVRASLTKKFIKVYRGFRHRKYGEPYPGKKAAEDSSDYSAEKDVDYPDEIKARADVLQQQLKAVETFMKKKEEKEKPKEELERVSEEGLDDELIETPQQYEHHV